MDVKQNGEINLGSGSAVFLPGSGSSYAGNVGIGITSPTDSLQVKSQGSDDGIALIKSNNTNQIVKLIETGTGDGALIAKNTSNAQCVLVRAQGSSYLNGGCVGIGTASPDTTLTIGQTADANGLKVLGYDDKNGSCVNLNVDASGHARLSQTTSGSSGYLFLQAENYLQLIAGTFIYTQNTFRIYDNAQLQFGNSGDYKISHVTANDTLVIHTDDNKGITMDNAGNTTFSSDITGSSLNLSSVVDAGADTDKFLVLDSDGNVDFRTGACVLSDIGGQGSGTYVNDAGGSARQVGVWSSATDLSGSNSFVL